MRGAGQMDVVEYVAPKRKVESLESVKTESAGTDFDRKFWGAMAMFAGLAALVWFTMDAGKVLVFGRPVELRLVPLIIVGALALRTVLARQAEKIRRNSQ
jgi:hypothetical protein